MLSHKYCLMIRIVQPICSVEITHNDNRKQEDNNTNKKPKKSDGNLFQSILDIEKSK